MRSQHARRSVSERFFDRVLPEPNSGCWLWEGYILSSAGYGIVRGKLAHRFSYELHYGAIPSGLDIHHKCGVTACVNPAHLKPMTRVDNVKLRNLNPQPKRIYITDQRSVIPRQASRMQRFTKFISKDAPNGCWLWMGATNGRYGVFDSGYAHRRSFELFKGAIGVGLTIDHLCRTPLCVNPDHLEEVTQAENTARAHRRELCKRGHAYDEKNTWYEKNGCRHCRKCHAIVAARWRKSKGTN